MSDDKCACAYRLLRVKQNAEGKDVYVCQTCGKQGVAVINEDALLTYRMQEHIPMDEPDNGSSIMFETTEPPDVA